MPKLLMIAPAPVIEGSEGQVKLDIKFVEGMRKHVAGWDGPVTCILRRGADHIPFGKMYNMRELGFELVVSEPGTSINLDELAPGDVISASTDINETLGFVETEHRPQGVKVVYSIENTLGTRARIVWFDQSRGFLRKAHSIAWLTRQEPRLRRALRLSDGFQVNGYPAFAQYSGLNDNAMIYFDGRMSAAMMADSDEMTARVAHLKTDRPLRIVHSGRLEPLKGGQDLIPIAAALHKAKVDFTLDIFGSGSLENAIAEDISSHGLQDSVRLHGAVDFEIELVPYCRENADLFLSCHRQSDPSCTYLESLGCGVPIVGYDNAMWKKMAAETQAGWAVPLGTPGHLASKIQSLSANRDEILLAAERGLEFARNHTFEGEFSKRMSHLAAVSGAA